ncbi:MAG: hypothetical protein EPN23_05550 [Verrucomicrobia bacterium]|nr:MAG: hypothetical protein EPN23_05550 [Verrucomicrobiota bacterium]
MHRNPQMLHLPAIVLLIVALFPMPAGYDLFLRIALCMLFGLIFAVHIERGAKVWPLICGAVIVLYNPIIRVHLTRAVWFGIHLATIIMVVISAVIVWRAHTRKDGVPFHIGRWF